MVTGCRGCAAPALSHMTRAKTSLTMVFDGGYETATIEVQFVKNIHRTHPPVGPTSIPNGPTTHLDHFRAYALWAHDPLGPPRAREMDELEPTHQEPALDSDLIEKHQEFVLLLCPERLFVGGTAPPLSTVLLVVALTVVGTNSAPERGLHHVVDGGLVTIPKLHLDRTRDRIVGWKLLFQALSEILGVVGDGEAVKMLKPALIVPTVLVLVETPVRGSEEPGDAGSTEGFFPTAGIASVLVRVEVSGRDLSVGWDHADANNLGPVWVGGEELERDLGGERLSCVGATGAGA